MKISDSELTYYEKHQPMTGLMYNQAYIGAIAIKQTRDIGLQIGIHLRDTTQIVFEGVELGLQFFMS